MTIHLEVETDWPSLIGSIVCFFFFCSTPLRGGVVLSPRGADPNGAPRCKVPSLTRRQGQKLVIFE